MISTALGFVLDHWEWFAGSGGGIGGIGLAALIPGVGPFLAGALTFLRANWKWAIPSVIAVLAVGWALWERGDYQSCKAAAAKRQADEDAAIIAQKDRERVLGGQISASEDEAAARVDAKATKSTEVIRNAEVTRDCTRSPAMRAAHDGLRELGFGEEGSAAAGDAQKAGGAQARPR